MGPKYFGEPEETHNLNGVCVCVCVCVRHIRSMKYAPFSSCWL